MPQFVMLVNWTDQGIHDVKDTPQRGKQFSDMVKQMGGTTHTLLWTMGRYDLVGIVEAPDPATASAIALKVSMLGNVHTETLPAFTSEEVQRIIDKL